MNQDTCPSPLSIRNETNIFPPRSDSPHNQLQLEALETSPENVPPRLTEVSYPKLPTRFSPPRSAQSRRCRLPELAADLSHSPDLVRTPANVGRRRANAISLINSPSRPSQNTEISLIFEQARKTLRSQEEALKQSREHIRVSKSYAQTRPNVAGDLGHSSSSIAIKSTSFPSNAYLSSSRLPPLTSAVVTKPLSRKSTAPESTPFASSIGQTSKELDPATAVASAKSSFNPNMDDPGDWTDDDVFFKQEPSRATTIENWLADVSEEAPITPSKCSESSSLASEQQNPFEVPVQEYLRTIPGFGIAERIKQKNMTSRESNDDVLKDPERSSNDQERSSRVLTHLIQPPLRTPRPARADRESKVLGYARSNSSGSRVGKDKRDQSSGSTFSNSATVRKSGLRSGRKTDKMCNDLPPSYSRSSSGSDRSETLVVRQQRRNRSSASKSADKGTKEAGMRNLTPEVEVFRKGKGRRTKARCPSYFDEDVISSPSRPSED